MVKTSNDVLEMGRVLESDLQREREGKRKRERDFDTLWWMRAPQTSLALDSGQMQSPDNACAVWSSAVVQQLSHSEALISGGLSCVYASRAERLGFRFTLGLIKQGQVPWLRRHTFKQSGEDLCRTCRTITDADSCFANTWRSDFFTFLYLVLI